MANVSVRKQLEKISNDLARVVEHIAQYSGVEQHEARVVDNLGTEISELGAMVATAARDAMGNRSAGSLTTKVRKALGYTKP